MPLLNSVFDDGILVVQFTKSHMVDQTEVAAIGEELDELITKADRRKMLINFEGVEHIGSVLIGQLYVLSKKCKAAGVDLKLCSVSEVVQDILRTVNLTHFVQICENRQDAWMAFHQEFEVAGPRPDGKTVDQLQQEAEGGDHQAQFELGKCFDEGRGIAQDLKKAFACYQRSAEQGNSHAQYALGTSYAYGIHVEQDFPQALQWYTKAAEQGHADAQYSVGMSHHYGIGTNENLEQAEKWYNMAGEQGHKLAPYAIEKLKHGK